MMKRKLVDTLPTGANVEQHNTSPSAVDEEDKMHVSAAVGQRDSGEECSASDAEEGSKSSSLALPLQAKWR